MWWIILSPVKECKLLLMNFSLSIYYRNQCQHCHLKKCFKMGLRREGQSQPQSQSQFSSLIFSHSSCPARPGPSNLSTSGRLPFQRRFLRRVWLRKWSPQLQLPLLLHQPAGESWALPRGPLLPPPAAEHDRDRQHLWVRSQAALQCCGVGQQYPRWAQL